MARSTSPQSRARITDRAAAFELCLYCPNLCRDACPVATVTGNDAHSPWGLMSLGAHLASQRLKPAPAIAAAFTACVNCGACTDACAYDNPVGEALVQVRAWLHAEDHPAPGAAPVVTADAASDGAAIPESAPIIEKLRATSRYEPHPTFSFVPGLGAFADEGGAILQFFGLCERLDLDALSCGELARLDAGYDLWWSGRTREFVRHARRVHAAAEGARDIVVMSAETLYLLREIYPRFGLRIAADMVHVSEFLSPLLAGAAVTRLEDRVLYHESCHLARHLKLRDIPREVLQRVLVQPLVELPGCGDLRGCCGGSAAPSFIPRTSEAMATGVVEAALEAGVHRLVSYSTECVVALSRARDRLGAADLRVQHATALVAEAVTGDGAAA